MTGLDAVDSEEPDHEGSVVGQRPTEGAENVSEGVGFEVDKGIPGQENRAITEHEVPFDESEILFMNTIDGAEHPRVDVDHLRIAVLYGIGSVMTPTLANVSGRDR